MAKTPRVYQDPERMVWQIPPRDGDLATGPPEKTGVTFQEASKGNKKVTRKAAGRRLLPCSPGCNEKV
jgi:hypothetical protein